MLTSWGVAPCKCILLLVPLRLKQSMKEEQRTRNILATSTLHFIGSHTTWQLDGNQMNKLWTRLGLDLDWIWIIQYQSNQQSYTRTDYTDIGFLQTFK